MAHFWDLPRELRDIIYSWLLLSTRTLPALPVRKFLAYDPSTDPRFKKIYDPQSSQRGEFGCAYATEAPPPTCAAFLSCNRQVHAEMSEARARLEKRDLIDVRLDCIALNESFHYFTWLRIPLVSTVRSASSPGWSAILPSWLRHVVLSALPTTPISSTRIPRLWIDVRLEGTRANKIRRQSNPVDRTGWALCAALKRLLELGPYFAPDHDMSTPHVLSVDELVLNVVSPTVPQSKLLDEDFPVDGVAEGTVHPRTVARELVSIWVKIWAGEQIRGELYATLLERVGRVRVLIDGELFGARELRSVLERGQRERRLITQRAGW